MKLPESKPLIVILLVIAGTLAAQIPSLEHIIVQITDKYPHLATLAEGLVGVIALLVATWKGKGDEQEQYTVGSAPANLKAEAGPPNQQGVATQQKSGMGQQTKPGGGR